MPVAELLYEFESSIYRQWFRKYYVFSFDDNFCCNQLSSRL